MSKVLSDLFVVPQLEQSSVLIKFTAPSGCKNVSWSILDGGRKKTSGSVKTRAGKLTEFSADIKNAKLWNINTPHLYTLKLILDIKGEEVIVLQKFGMRDIKTSGTELLVNSKPFIARGYIRGREAHDHPNMENLPLYDFYAKNIRAAKAYGFNLIRFHSRIPPKECFEAADDLGIFIHVELRKYYGKYQKERAGMKDTGDIISEEQWRETVKEIRNHPSLMVYCMGNEIRHPGTNPFVEHIAGVTKELDPTRLFIDTCDIV